MLFNLKNILILLIIFSSLEQLLFGQDKNFSSFNVSNLYETGIKENKKVLMSGDPSRIKDSYKQLMILYRSNAEFYRILAYSASAVSNKFYMERIKNKQSIGNFIYFYQGIGQFYLKDYSTAIKSFQLFLSKEKQQSNLGKIWLGATYYKTGDQSGAVKIWNTISFDDEATIKYEFMKKYIEFTSASEKPLPNFKNLPNRETIKDILFLELKSDISEKWKRVEYLLNKIDLSKPDYLERIASKDSIDYYDPIQLDAISNSMSYLSFYYANLFNTLADIKEQSQVNSQLYRSLYYYDFKQYNEVVKILQGNGDLNSRIVLASATAKLGKISEAKSMIDNLVKETSSDFNKKSELGYKLLRYELDNIVDPLPLVKYAYLDAIRSSENESKIRKLFFNYGFCILLSGNCEQAYNILQGGINKSRFNLQFNSPEYCSIFVTSIILWGNYSIIESEAFPVLKLLSNEFSSAQYLISPVSKIDNLSRPPTIIITK